MKPKIIFNLLVKAFGVYFLYQAIHSFSSYLVVLGSPISMGQATLPVFLDMIVLGVAAVWFLFGAPPIQQWAYPDAEDSSDLSDSTSSISKQTIPTASGPPCVSCGKPVPSGSKACSACGWTQPG